MNSLDGIAALDRSRPLNVGQVLFEQEAISSRVKELAREIESDFTGRELSVIGVLAGGFHFMSDLVRDLRIPVSLDFVAISRYQSAPGSKRVKLIKDLDDSIEGRHILLVDDIVDTGLSLHYLVQQLRRRSPASVSAASLLVRPELRIAEIPLDYIGFEVSAEFLIGYGLDHRGLYRDLPFIATLRPSDEGVLQSLGTPA